MFGKRAFFTSIPGRAFFVVLGILILSSAVFTLSAQDAPNPEDDPAAATPTPLPEPIVSIEADDGLALSGVYYDPGGDRPAIVLLHQMYSSRGSWADVIQPLLDAGFKVLIVDIRGFGDTRGRLNWTSAQADTVTWATWLREQPGVTSVMFMGSSIGSSLALVGCSQVEGCAGAVALSPGLNYYQVYTGDAIVAGFPALIVYADHDPYPIRDVPKMIELADPDGDGAHHLSLQVYAGREHGMELFAAHDELVGAITSWLADHD